MKLRQIEYFVTVAEAGSLTKASRLLFIAQPTLSQQMSALESELGAKLFDRLPRGLQLTPEGRAFLIEARNVLAALGRAQATVQAARTGATGELRLAAVTSIAVKLLPDAVGRWYRSHPKVTLFLSEFNHAGLLEEALLSDGADLAIGPAPRHPPGAVLSLGMEEFVFVLPNGDPLSSRSHIEAADLAEHNWVLFAADHGLNQIVERICAQAGFTPKVAARTNEVTTAARLAASGLGPTLLPVNAIDTKEVIVRSAKRPILRELAVYARNRFTALDRSLIAEFQASDSAPRPLQSYPISDGYVQL